MPLTFQAASLQMEWCLTCHREPERFIRPRSQIFNMDWTPPPDQETAGAELAQQYNLLSRQLHAELFVVPQVNAMPKTPIDISEIRRRLAQSEGPAYWRSLEELAESKEFRQADGAGISGVGEPLGQLRWIRAARKLLKVMGASLALMGLNGCFYKRPQEKLVPYPQPPEEIVPGRRLFRHGDAVLRLRQGRAGSEPGGPADQDRGESRSSGEPGRRPMCSCRLRFWICMTRIARGT